MKKLCALALALATLCADAGNRLQLHQFRSPWNPLTATLDNGATVAEWWSASDIKFNEGVLTANVIDNWTGAKGLQVTATTTARPTWSATSFNSAYAGMTFDGSANTMVTTTLTSLPTGSTAGEVWYVGNAVTTGSLGIALCYGGVTNPVERIVRKAVSGSSDAAQILDGTTINVGATMVGNHIVMGDFAGTTELGFIDGVAFGGNPATIASLATGTTRLRIGANCQTSAGSFFQGVVADIMVTSGTISTADRQRLEGFFAWRYGLASILPASHPYRWAAP